MSNIALFDGAKVPAFAKQREGKSALAQALGGDDFGKRISIKGGVFRLMSSGKEIANIEERYLDVVFVNAAPKTSRVWYAKPYDGEAQRADCCLPMARHQALTLKIAKRIVAWSVPRT